MTFTKFEELKRRAEDRKNQSRFSMLKEKNSLRKTVWTKAKDLLACNAVFSIFEINKSNGKLGQQWVFTIKLRHDTNEEFDFGVPEGCKLCFSLSCTDGRDNFIRDLKTELPLHNCYLSEISMESNNTFIDLCHLEEGEERWEPEPVTLESLLSTSTTAIVRRRSTNEPVIYSSPKADSFIPDYESEDTSDEDDA